MRRCECGRSSEAGLSTGDGRTGRNRVEGRPGLCIMCVLYFYTRQHALPRSTSTNGFCRCCSLNCPLARTSPVLYWPLRSCYNLMFEKSVDKKPAVQDLPFQGTKTITPCTEKHSRLRLHPIVICARENTPSFPSHSSASSRLHTVFVHCTGRPRAHSVRLVELIFLAYFPSLSLAHCA